MSALRFIPDRAALAFWALMLAIVALRIVALRMNELDLHFDEAQYWAWSRHFDWGYFSKPPLIAWTIAGATALFGDAEWAVRLAAPIAHGIAGLALYWTGRAMYGPWQGFWAGLGWLLLPSVTLSSGIISTDALLLPLWSLALLAAWRLTVTRAWSWAIALGLAIGLGALAKYAMLYFPICALVAAWWVKPVREALFNPRGILAALIALSVLAGNLYWNIEPCFQTAAEIGAEGGSRQCLATIGHTAANAALPGLDMPLGDLSQWGQLGRFLIEQSSIIGPVLFILFVGLLFRALARMRALSDEDRFLLAFILPPILVISIIALLSRAHANWAVAAFPAAMVWIAGSMMSRRSGVRWLAIGAAANIVIGAAIVMVALQPEFGDRIGLSNTVKRTRNWEETAQAIAIQAMAEPGEAPFTAVLVDDRATYFELTYYWREARRAGAPLPPVRMWLLHSRALNSAEQTDPMRPAEGARVLVVHARPAYRPLVAGDFTGFRTVDHIAIDLGGGKSRDYEISVGELYAPAPRDEAFEARIPD